MSVQAKSGEVNDFYKVAVAGQGIMDQLTASQRNLSVVRRELGDEGSQLCFKIIASSVLTTDYDENKAKICGNQVIKGKVLGQHPHQHLVATGQFTVTEGGLDVQAQMGLYQDGGFRQAADEGVGQMAITEGTIDAGIVTQVQRHLQHQRVTLFDDARLANADATDFSDRRKGTAKDIAPVAVKMAKFFNGAFKQGILLPKGQVIDRVLIEFSVHRVQQKQIQTILWSQSTDYQGGFHGAPDVMAVDGTKNPEEYERRKNWHLNTVTEVRSCAKPVDVGSAELVNLVEVSGVVQLTDGRKPVGDGETPLRLHVENADKAKEEKHTQG